MSTSYDLTKLDPNVFEHLVNFLALEVLGAGTTGFGPGPDGGRDGYLKGDAPYPTTTERWSGRWYIQSKFHQPHLSKDAQKWLCEQIEQELKAFKDPNSKREWPDNWIIATNIDPSGKPHSGAYDRACDLVRQATAGRKLNFDIWGGRKILDFLARYPKAAEYYRHFLTPGHVLKAMYDQLQDAVADVKTILRYLIVNQFKENQYTKLDQAGSSSDVRPGIHELFIDLPFHIPEYDRKGLVTEYLVRASSRCHRPAAIRQNGGLWREWNRQPDRARVWILKAGPGQGKSTIGQYFSQIQRAALIVDSDDHPVSETYRALAQAVRGSALAAGFWPLVPRIPVMIELKDFAKWFGEQAKDEARGILTYFSGKIAQVVEQPVRAATLKRALGERGWFIVFDGLDEVPNDVKDAVAAEVRTFVDEVIIEVNGDILTLCTSRPQGYSGQFSDMDGPVANLTSLPPDVALQCAKPVLTFNRSGEEGRKSLEVLKAAIASPSVQELMTTPLQAHIMAVVVRDGGRPPERRWQLFSNFYQVMRKREALKDFPNPRVAKLLREDEQLLKAIHARIGFLLHARAETSQGAQTRLDRDEFKSLAIQTVSHFHEENVAATVDALMEATTERLVLVSTPESGEHVRFDIRQLQEFFAAEFLYDGITADDLRPRIEIVAGDAHWREVMHFLLSALIENKRTTELSVAINVLNQLNDREGGSPARMFYRRMGRGALLASRLLQEGVLEQDKRVRQLFRSVLEPITGMLENEKLVSLASEGQTNSKAWLVNFMVDILLEADFSESVGASIVLAQILPDDHPRTPQVKRRYLSAPKAYQEFVISSIARKLYYPKRLQTSPPSIIREWFLEAVLDLIIREDWTEFSGPGLNACLRVLRVNEERSAGIARELGWPTSHVELLLFLLTEDNQPQPPTAKPFMDYGIFSAHAYQHDWSTGTFPRSLWSSGIPHDASNAPGLLQVVFRALRFGLTRSHGDLASVLDEISRFPDIFSAIPQRILAYLPINFWGDSVAAQIARLRRLTDSDLGSALQQQLIGADKLHRPLVPNFKRGDKCTLPQWIKLTKDVPELAVHYWFDDWRVGGPRPASLDSPAAVSALIQALETQLNLAASYILAWGKLFAVAPAYEVQLRGIMLRATNRTALDQFFGTQSIHPYRIDLVEEHSVLPALAAALAEHFSRFDKHFVLGAEEKRRTAEELFSGFGLSPAPLNEIARQSQQEANVRAAALILYLLEAAHGNAGNVEPTQLLADLSPLIIELYSECVSRWYLSGVRVFLDRLFNESDVGAVELTGRLFELAREDYTGRQTLHELLAKWREGSSAPVHTANVQQAWLES